MSACPFCDKYNCKGHTYIEIGSEEYAQKLREAKLEVLRECLDRQKDGSYYLLDMIDELEKDGPTNADK